MFVSHLEIPRQVMRIFTARLYNELLGIAISSVFLCFRSPDQYNPSYTRFDQDMEDSVHHIVRDQFGNVVGSVYDFAGSGDDETEEDAGVFEDVFLVAPAMDVLNPVVRSPLPSVVNELYKAFKMLETNR